MRFAKKSLTFLLSVLAIGFSSASLAEEQRRARDLGAPFPGTPGPYNAITDVAGVEVGHTTIIKGKGKLVRRKGPVRTGVTAIHPRGKDSISPVFGGWFTLNASGEMTGTTWLEERGFIDGPILITNTHSVGVARDGAVEWMVDKGWKAKWHAPIAAETYDGMMSDINGFHVKPRHVRAALENAKSGPVEEGAVGGGTGMECNDFKGGIGTSSRVVKALDKEYTVGVLVQCNYGSRESLLHVAGVPMDGLKDAPRPCFQDPALRPTSSTRPICGEPEKPSKPIVDGSIIIVVATDAPLLPVQLNRIAKRPSLAIGRLGGVSSGGSGDIFIAFSTANENQFDENKMSRDIDMFPNNKLTALFGATVDATEEAIVNAMIGAKTMTGINTYTITELPEDKFEKIMEDATK
ncbi:MAG: P1 family peptidase [Pseudomonadota bacterium]